MGSDNMDNINGGANYDNQNLEISDDAGGFH